MAYKKPYWLISGEGERGTWERVVTTPLGIKQRLARERCHGDRWAIAYQDPYISSEGLVCGWGVENDPPSPLPEEARNDVVSHPVPWPLD